MTTPAEAARTLLALGLAPIPVHPRNKQPVHTGWTTLRITSDSIDQYFNGGDYNVGVLLGEPSNWAVDVDLDVLEAINLAHLFLPATATFGRASKPCSHYVYKVAEPVETCRFQASDGTVLLELRSTGAQTVFPASVHESGELIQWSSDCPAIASIAPNDLQRRLEWLAAAALLARQWPRVNGDRQERAMALAGALLNSGWSEANVASYV